MRYFYIFILTLILISCNEKKGYSKVEIEYGEDIEVTSESECRNVVEKGKILSTYFNKDTLEEYSSKVKTRILYKGYIYWITMYTKSHICYDKRKFHDK